MPIRRLGPADLTACQALSLDRGWSAGEAVWRFMLSFADGFGIDDPAGGLAACVLVVRYGEEVAAVGMMLVASSWERRGLARRLMEHVLAYAGDRVVMLYATELGRPLYEKLGFRAIDYATRYVGVYQPGADLGRVRPGTADDLAAVVRLDAKVFGVDRSDLLVRLADGMYVAADGPGHALARDEGERLVVGPLAAHDERTACALVDAHARRVAVPVRLDVPPRFAGLSGWLRESGLAPRVTHPLMVYGGRLKGDRTIPYAIASLSLG